MLAFCCSKYRNQYLATLRIVNWKLNIVSSISLEVCIIPQPSSDLLTQIVSNSLGLLGVHQILVARVQWLRNELCHLCKNISQVDHFEFLSTYCCITSGVSSIRSAVKVLETLRGYARSKNLLILRWIHSLQLVWESTKPGKRKLWLQILQEDTTLVLVTKIVNKNVMTKS